MPGKEFAMVTCPKCKAENRPEAAFCSRCGTILFAQPAPAKPAEALADNITEEGPAPVKPPEQASPVEHVFEAPAEPEVPEQPAMRGLQSRPEGTLFGDRFRYAALLSESEHENSYTVTEEINPEQPAVRICSNPECRTIHCPVNSEPEKYCTQCGNALEENPLLFLLQETDDDKFGYIKHVQELNLVHPNIHPPIATFHEELADGTRYYLASPFSGDLPERPEISDVLEWGIQLAGALDYLQSRGMVLGDEFDNSSIGLAEHKAVWRNFTSVRILPMLTDREKINNLRLLNLAMYSLMTGRTSYGMDPYLPGEINDLFERALVGEGFTSGAELAQQIERVKTGATDRLVLGYQVGMRSHTGKVRELNEDSLLSIEQTTFHHGSAHPRGMFAIADGMGGHAAGDVASELVVNQLAQKANCEILSLDESSQESCLAWLREAVQAANLAVHDARQKADNDMGSTVVAGLLVGAQAFLAYQGDSRIYLVNQESIRQLSTDHSLVQHMINIGQISEEEAKHHPQRNVIYRSLGDQPYVEVDCVSQVLFPHDRLLLCSDGLTNLVEDEKLQEIILEASSAQAACDQLVETANLAGGDDNISAILIEIASL
jgi:serine/threonine protein phosphatase PrpC